MNIRTYTEQDTIFATTRLRLPREVNASMEKWNKLAHTFHARVTFIPGMERPIGPLGNYTQTLTVTIEGDCDDPQCQKLFDALYSGDPQKIELIKKELRYGRSTDDTSSSANTANQSSARNTPKHTAPQNRAIAVNSSDTTPLIKRIFMFLEDGEWDRVNEYCETVLDLDPENALAYLGMLMAELKVTRFKDLKDQPEPFDGNANYKKAVRFADEKLKTALLYYSKQITVRLENERYEEVYQKACSEMDSSPTKEAQLSAAEMFTSILGYKDADEKRKSCLERAEDQKKNEIYNLGISLMKSQTVHLYRKAIEQFEQISGWKDANELILQCNQRIAKLTEQEQASAKKAKRVLSIVIPLMSLLVVLIIIVSKVSAPNRKYNDAVSLMDAENYEEAMAVFNTLDGYKDSNERSIQCSYEVAMELMDNGKFMEAIAIFEEISGFQDSVSQISQCQSRINYLDACKESCFNDFQQIIADVYARQNDSAPDITAIYESTDVNGSNFVLKGKYYWRFIDGNYANCDFTITCEFDAGSALSEFSEVYYTNEP